MISLDLFAIIEYNAVECCNNSAACDEKAKALPVGRALFVIRKENVCENFIQIALEIVDR